ncbi:MAG TPA: Imm10 family immunity protein [Actinocrinis sp.]|nr:Imm10 family immunity protein [Actinocrinis sp.]
MPSPDFTTAAMVTVEENMDAFTVGLAEDEAGEGAYLILQCALTPPTDQDSVTGMDTYCLMDDQGVVHYGGVRRAEIADATVRFRFDEDAADELGVQNPQRELSLSVPADVTERLAVGLHRILTYGDPAQRPELVGI